MKVYVVTVKHPESESFYVDSVHLTSDTAMRAELDILKTNIEVLTEVKVHHVVGTNDDGSESNPFDPGSFGSRLAGMATPMVAIRGVNQ